jgi:hypothetical protein
VLNREETMGAHHVGLVSEAQEIAMVARSRDVSLDEATELIETYARVVAPPPRISVPTIPQFK